MNQSGTFLINWAKTNDLLTQLNILLFFFFKHKCNVFIYKRNKKSRDSFFFLILCVHKTKLTKWMRNKTDILNQKKMVEETSKNGWKPFAVRRRWNLNLAYLFKFVSRVHTNSWYGLSYMLQEQTRISVLVIDCDLVNFICHFTDHKHEQRMGR